MVNGENFDWIVLPLIKDVISKLLFCIENALKPFFLWFDIIFSVEYASQSGIEYDIPMWETL